MRSLLIAAQDPDIIYLGTSSGTIFKSKNAGKSWIALYPGIGREGFVIDTLVQHPNDPDHIYAGAWDLHSEGGGLFESDDAGISWKQIKLTQTSSAIRGLSICRKKPDYMIAGTLEGAYLTADGGRKWKQVGGRELQKAESVAIDPTDPRILYVGTWRLGYKSNNSGRNWTMMATGMPLDSDVFSISIDTNNPSTVFSSACSGVYRSTNSAKNWTRLKILPDRFTIRAQVVYIDPGNSSTIYTGTTEGLFVSYDNGISWVRLTPDSVTVNAIQVDPRNNKRIMIGTEYQGIMLSDDGGKTWKESNSGFIHKQISWIVPDTSIPENFYVGIGSGRGGIYSYDHDTGKWQSSQIIPGMRILSFLVLPQNKGKLAGTTEGLYWQQRISDKWIKVKGAISRRIIHGLTLDPSSPVIYAGTDHGVYRTSLAAMDFRLPPNSRLSPVVWCIAASASDPGMIYAGSSLGILRSWDKGTTWSVISFLGLPERAMIQTVAVSPSHKEQLFAGTSGGLYESIDGGINWRRSGDGRLSFAVSSIIFMDKTGDRLVSADKTTGRIHYSSDRGLNWETISSREDESPVNCLINDPRQPSLIYAGTVSNGIYRFEIQEREARSEKRE